MNTEIKDEILRRVRDYYDEYQTRKPASDAIPYAGRVYDEEELVTLVDSALEFWLTGGRYTEQFERGLAEYLGVSYCSFVNSGSSANLLAFMALTSPELGERRIVRGDEVITTACGFPTTVAPIVQYGAVPVFVDVTLPNCGIDVDQMEQALSARTKAVMAAHTLGVPFDLERIKAFCHRNGLWLVEDNCDALGSEIMLDGRFQKTGTVGDIGTSSFYPAHHITTGEGGAVYTNDPLLHKITRSLRDWGRACSCPPGRDNVCGHRFDGQFGQLPPGYDHKFTYSHLGYNLKATDLQAAVGVAQLGKLERFTARRRENWSYLRQALAPLEKYLLLPEKTPGTEPSWFGFLITVREDSPVSRDGLVAHLEANKIQTRPLFAGNLTRHPCFQDLEEGKDYRIAGTLEVTDQVMNNSFWLGVYPGMERAMLDRIITCIEDCLGQGK